MRSRQLTPEQFCDSFERQFPGVTRMELGFGNDAERNYYEQVFDIWRSRRGERFWDSDGNSDGSQDSDDF